MTADEPDAITSVDLDAPEDDEDDDGMPARRYWWSLHRPETYAISALLLAVLAMIADGLIQYTAQTALLAAGGGSSQRTILLIIGGVRLAMVMLAFLTAALSISSEDDDTTWSAPLARSALVVAGLAAAMTIAGLISAALINVTPNGFGG